MRKACIAAMVCSLAGACIVPLQAQAMTEEEVHTLALEAGREYGICPELLQAIAWKESRYQEDADNDGCQGLMQTDGRWHGDRMAELGAADLNDPADNMAVAADYLAELFT